MFVASGNEPALRAALAAAGYPFEIHIDELDKSFPARVTRSGARIDPMSQSIKVTGEITGKADGLIAGMSGRLKLAPKQ